MEPVSYTHLDVYKRQPDAPADPTGGAPMVGIIMGSSSDAATMAPAAEVLARFGVSHEVRVISAHRSPHRMVEYATGACLLYTSRCV